MLGHMPEAEPRSPVSLFPSGRTGSTSSCAWLIASSTGTVALVACYVRGWDSHHPTLLQTNNLGEFPSARSARERSKNRGVEVSPRRAHDASALAAFLRYVEAVGFSDAAALHYAEIRANLKKRGKMIGACSQNAETGIDQFKSVVEDAAEWSPGSAERQRQEQWRALTRERVRRYGQRRREAADDHSPST